MRNRIAREKCFERPQESDIMHCGAADASPDGGGRMADGDEEDLRGAV
jgi:hypothetical protein